MLMQQVSQLIEFSLKLHPQDAHTCKVALQIHPLEWSVVLLSCFYHELYQNKLHHKGGVRHGTSLMNRKGRPLTALPMRAPRKHLACSTFAFRLFP